MSYFDVYQSRINHMGHTTAERIRNSGIRSFDKWLRESPHTVPNLSVERGIYFPGIILTNKDREERKLMLLNVANEVALTTGDIMNWQQDNGEIEKWLLLTEEKMVNGIHRTFWIIKCNYLLKWIDAQGHLQKSWSYVVSSVDSKIKGNFRTWNNLITPQPNKYAEIIMPRQVIDRATNFIIEDESWTVVEYDHTSVPGIIYLSLTENKVNMIYDDLVKDIADTDKLAQYSISAAEATQKFTIGAEVRPVFTLMKNGIPCDLPVNIVSNNTAVVKNVNGILTAIGAGTTTLTVSLQDYPEQFTSIDVEVAAEIPQEVYAYISGPDKIRLGREAEYHFIVNNDNVSITFTINDTTKAKIISNDTLSCIIKANEKNELGNFVLSVLYNGIEYTKNITVIPLW